MFFQIVSEGGLEVQSLQPAEQKACTYDQKPITLDGQMTMKVSFGDKTIDSIIIVCQVGCTRQITTVRNCLSFGYY